MKTTITILGLLLLMNAASAACEGHITLLGIQDLYPGDEMQVVIDVAIPSSLGVRNLDVTLEDPDNRKISVGRLQLSNDTSAIETSLDITDNFLSGEYTLRAKVEVFEHSNITVGVCTEQVSADFDIITGRHSYSGITLELTIKDEYVTYSYNTTSDISFGDATIPMTVAVKNVPMGVDINILDFNFSNDEISDIEVRPETPMYPYGFVKLLKGRLESAYRSVDICEDNQNKTMTEVAGACSVATSICKQCNEQTQAARNDTRRCETSKNALIKEKNELEEEIDSLDGFLDYPMRMFYIWFIWGILFILLGYGINWWFATQLHEDRKFDA